ncbi:catechol 2,3-dioxygenase-like lactoylglutathione lyase family enzyme [Rhodovulum imhoffii]|uniref:Catechol 2,3-dioxygenase-like lactoylglutathione lyase family enzyme n=1 Tax=Rhodovulum imhoffii TaxID=365340 RepID=A0A2T5BNX9_9RHOB|nr:VOC family protein [Rhodovulum imhoffii]MBK5933631.1 glyoxalase [Rhodovulum imhoffii]PTN00714.1 catechol 2,3-dioxygenase-like lactoylglutathione lyase family enzyme [Rhodovulum imhoffii]
MTPVLGLHHIGFTVPDMEEAVAFFRDVFGAVTIMECGSVDVDDAFMSTHLGVPKGVRIADQRVIQVGRGGSLELFEYRGVEGEQHLKHNGEAGAMHIAFEVDDAYAVAERMRAARIDLLEGPTLIEGGPMHNLVWLYLRAPWGQYLEIVSQNGPLGYEADGGPRLWTPSQGK